MARWSLPGWTASRRGRRSRYAPRAPYTVNQPLNAYSWAGPYLGGNLGYEWGIGQQQPDQAVRLRRRRAGRLQLAERPVGVRRRGRHPGDRRRRHFRALEVLQSLVRHAARPRRLCLQQHPVLRHRAASPSASCAAQTFGLSESHTTAGWTAGVGAEVGFAPNWSAKIEYLYVDLSSSQFAITGVSNGYRFGVVPRRRELSLLIATRRYRHNHNSRPRRRPGFFYASANSAKCGCGSEKIARQTRRLRLNHEIDRLRALALLVRLDLECDALSFGQDPSIPPARPP